MRATYNHVRMRKALSEYKLKIFSWSPALGTGWHLIWRLIRLNYVILLVVMTLTATSAALFYTPALFLRKFVQYLEVDPNRENKGWGWIYVMGLFVTDILAFLGKSFFYRKRSSVQILIDDNSFGATLVDIVHDRSTPT